MRLLVLRFLCFVHCETGPKTQSILSSSLSGLSNGTFACQEFHLGICMYVFGKLGEFHSQLVYYIGIWFIMLAFGLLCWHLVYYGGIWFIMLAFGLLCWHLVYFVVIRYIFCNLVIEIRVWSLIEVGCLNEINDKPL
jgi:hypothetical protein